MKKLIIFDLDGTIAESKSAVDKEMAKLLNELMLAFKVSIISGASIYQFKKQVLSKLKKDKRLMNLYILPTCGTSFYEYSENWKKLYSEDLSEKEKNLIFKSLKNATKELNEGIDKIYGEQIEDRGSQITYSALGQKAPLKKKEAFDPDFKRRQKVKSKLKKLIPQFSVNLGGMTSIDITKKGIDKEYGIRKLNKKLKIPLNEMLFIGDAIFPGGNDYPAVKAGVDTIKTKDPLETKHLIQALLACVD
ncbi:HAD-IIB family hydrolase [soil metagenome]